jgi:rubrerythrin
MNLKELKYEVYKLMNQGLSVSEISIALNESESRIQRIVERKFVVEDLNTKDLRDSIFRLKAEENNSLFIATKLDVPIQLVESIIAKDRAKIKINPKWEEVLARYRNGETLEKIAQPLGLTRERVRQIIKQQLYVENGYGPSEAHFRKKQIEEIARAIVKDSATERPKEWVLEKIQKSIDKGIDPIYFTSLNKYAKTIGVTVEHIKNYAPEYYRIVDANAHRLSEKWNPYYNACVNCGTTEVKHRAKGYCANCYYKSAEFKQMQQRSHIKHKEARDIKFKEYYQEYSNRPEVIEKTERAYDLKYFGGNRKAVLERDGYVCKLCGKTMEEKDSVGKPKVKVWHISADKNDHSMSNLGTYCLSCYTKHIRIASLGNWQTGRS